MTAPGVKQPSIATVKRLFALSGNRCAFPGCELPIIEKSGSVIGEVCHISARSKEGPRYDPIQSNEDRHGFENLILLCAIHHKVIDEQWESYPAAALQEMKGAHMKAHAVVEATDAAAVSLLKNSGFAMEVYQESGSHGINVAASGSTIVVSSGVSYAEVKEIALDIYRSNALELRGFAESVALQRAEALTEKFLMELRSRAADGPPASLAQPDMQHVLFAAQKHAARSGDPDFSEVLVDLLVDRALTPGRDLLQIVLNEAVETAGRLTTAQFDALSLIFVLRYTRSLSVRTAVDLVAALDRHISPFIDSAPNTRVDFQHLQYAACGSIGLASVTLESVLANTYGHVFADLLQDRVEVADALSCSDIEVGSLITAGCFRLEQGGRLSIGPMFDIESQPLFLKLGFSEQTHTQYRKLVMQKAAGKGRLAAQIGAYSRLERLTKWWDDLPSKFELTSVGIALAHANLRRKGIEGFDLRTWIG